MIHLLSILLGLLGSSVPDLFKLLRARQDNAHELAVMQLQIEAQKDGAQAHLEEIRIGADVAITQAAHAPIQLTGIHWVDALNATVRPVLAYAFFMAYAGYKFCCFFALRHAGLPWQYGALWTEADMMIFELVVSFYFGSRNASRARQGK